MCVCVGGVHACVGCARRLCGVHAVFVCGGVGCAKCVPRVPCLCVCVWGVVSVCVPCLCVCVGVWGVHGVCMRV